jgi:hypothetical protein
MLEKALYDEDPYILKVCGKVSLSHMERPSIGLPISHSSSRIQLVPTASATLGRCVTGIMEEDPHGSLDHLGKYQTAKPR